MTKPLKSTATILTKGVNKMKAFSVVFRDKETDKLYGGIVDQTELCRLSNLETITICCVREVG